MIHTRNTLLPFCLAVLAAVSCARTPAEPQNFSTDRVLQAWVEKYRPGIEKDTSGTYILELEEGSGRSMGDTSYIFVNCVCRTLDSRVSWSNDPELMEKMGLLSGNSGRLTYLGPRIWKVGKGYLPHGLESVIHRLREGGRISVAIPVGRSGIPIPVYQHFQSSQSDNIIYDIEVVRILDEIRPYQDSLLADFSKKYYGGVDSLFDGFYFVKTGSAAQADSIEDEETLSIRYIGRRLDGVAFDSNIKDTIGMLKLNSSTDSLVFTYYKNLDKMFSYNSSYILGFTAAINRMRHRDTVVAFFRSDYGYAAAGSSNSIPEYSPLCFKIFIQETEKQEEED